MAPEGCSGWLVAGLVVAASLLPGCLSSTPERPAPPATDPTGALVPVGEEGALGGSPGNGAGGLVYRFESSTPAIPLHSIIWANGTFEPLEACHSGNEWCGRETDITDRVPQGIPTMLVAKLEDEPPLFSGEGRPILYVDSPEYYSSSNSYDGDGDIEVNVSFVPLSGGPYVVGVRWDIRPILTLASAHDYSLRIEIRGEAERVPQYEPVELPLAGEGSGFTITPWERTEDPPQLVFALWGPGDEFVGRYEANETPVAYVLPQGAPPGNYVFLLGWRGESVRLGPWGASSGSMAMRALRDEWVEGTPRAVSGDQPVVWSFDVTRAPLAVGMAVQMGGGPLSYHYAENFRGEIRSPSERVLAFEGSDSLRTCSVGCAYWYGWGEGAHSADLPPGSYEAEFQATRGINLHVWERVTYYVR